MFVNKRDTYFVKHQKDYTETINDIFQSINMKNDKKFQDIPILMITARTQEEDKLIGEETGADEYITKPFEISNVIDFLAKDIDSI